MKPNFEPLAGCILFLGLCGAVWAGGTDAEESSFGGGVPPRAQAAFTADAPTVDGILDDKAWVKAPALFFPVPSDKFAADLKPPCETHFLWTEAGVFVAFRTTDATPAFGHFKPGEPLYQEDVFELFIDQIGDHRQYYEIQMDPAGQIFIKNYVLTAPPRLTSEKRLTPEFGNSEMWRYDLARPEGFQIASKLNSQTHVWTLEAFLPAAFVNRRRGAGPMKPCAWRLNLVRHDWDLPKDDFKRQVRFMYWAPVLPGHPHLSPKAMGWMEFVKP